MESSILAAASVVRASVPATVFSPLSSSSRPVVFRTDVAGPSPAARAVRCGAAEVPCLPLSPFSCFLGWSALQPLLWFFLFLNLMDGTTTGLGPAQAGRRDVQLVGGDPVGERQVHQLHRRRAGHPHPPPLPPQVPVRGRRRRQGRPAQRPGADHLGQGGRGVAEEGQGAAPAGDGVRRARAAAKGLCRGAGRRAPPQRPPRAHRRGQEGVAHQGPAQGALQSGQYLKHLYLLSFYLSCSRDFGIYLLLPLKMDCLLTTSCAKLLAGRDRTRLREERRSLLEHPDRREALSGLAFASCSSSADEIRCGTSLKLPILCMFVQGSFENLETVRNSGVNVWDLAMNP